MGDRAVTAAVVFVVFLVAAGMVGAYSSGNVSARFSDPRAARQYCESFCREADGELVEMQAHGSAEGLTCVCFFGAVDPE
jgi:hypothetical protein